MSMQNRTSEKFGCRRNGSRQNGSRQNGTNHKQNRSRQNGNKSVIDGLCRSTVRENGIVPRVKTASSDA